MGAQSKAAAHGTVIQTATLSATGQTGWLPITAEDIASVVVIDEGSMDATVVLEARVFDDDEAGDLKTYTVESYTSGSIKNFEAGESCEIRLRISVWTAGTIYLRVAKS